MPHGSIFNRNVEETIEFLLKCGTTKVFQIRVVRRAKVEIQERIQE